MLISNESRARRKDSNGDRCQSSHGNYHRASPPQMPPQHAYDGPTLGSSSPWLPGYSRRPSDASRTYLPSAMVDSDQVSLGSLGDESLELTTNHSQSVGGVLALLDLMGDRELEQAIDAIERQELESVVEFPNAFRIIFIGQASAADKQCLLDTFLSSLAMRVSGSYPLLEQRYHVTRLAGIKGEGKCHYYQDHGLSVIMTDLMHNSVDSTERYIRRQCGSTLSHGKSIASMLPSPPSSLDTGFDGFVYPDKTPNGIDLCIYFHDQREREDDLQVLKMLAQHGVSFIPILTNSPSFTSAATIDLSSRRESLAAVLAQHKLTGVDLCHFEVETPSFMRPPKRPQVDSPVASSRVAHHSPYPILTVSQFSALHPMRVYDILKHVRKKGIDHDHARQLKLDPTHSLSSPSSPWSKHRAMGEKVAMRHLPKVHDDEDGDDEDYDRFSPSRLVVLILMVTLMASVMGVWWVWYMEPRSSRGQWTASLSLGMPTQDSLSLFVDVQHNRQRRWSPVAPVLLVNDQQVAMEEDDTTESEGRYRASIPFPECGSSALARQVRLQSIPWMHTVYGSPLLLSSHACQPRLTGQIPVPMASLKAPRKKQSSPSIPPPAPPRHSLWSRLSGLQKSVNYCLSHGSQVLETIMHGESAPLHLPEAA